MSESQGWLVSWLMGRGGERQPPGGLVNLLCVPHFTLRVGFCFRIQEASPREWPSEVSPKRTLFPNN